MAPIHDAPGPGTADPSGRRAAWGVVALTAATVLVGALVPGPAGHAPVAASVGTPETDAACLEWSDGCRICRRLAEGSACSLPGIACTPSAPRCRHRADG